MNKAVVSAVALADEREIKKEIVDATAEKSFANNMKAIGRFVPTKEPVYYHWLHGELGVIGSFVGSTITGSTTATISAPLTAATSGFFRIGDQVTLSSDNRNAVITALSTSAGVDTITMQMVDNAAVTFANTNKITWTGRNDIEGGTAPTNIRYIPTSNFNQLGISTENDVITDIQYHSQTTFMGADGQPYIQGVNHERKVLNVMKAMSASLVGSQISTDLFSTASPTMAISGKAPQTSRGFDQYITTLGASSAITTAGFNVDMMVDKVFDDPTTFSSGTNKVGKRIYFVPKDNVPVSGGSAPRISVRYFDPKAEKSAGPNVKWIDIIKEAHFGALAPIPTSSTRELQTTWTAYYGLEMIGSSQTVYAQTLA